MDRAQHAGVPAALLVALLLLLSGRALAEPQSDSKHLHAALQAGAAAPAGRFATAPAIGLTAGLQWSSRVGAELELLQSSHGVEGAPLAIRATSITLGPVLEVDRLPIRPILSIGAAAQLASRSDGVGESVLIPGAYAAIGLRTVLFDHLFAAARMQYLTTAFGSESFPAYTSFVLQLGGMIDL